MAKTKNAEAVEVETFKTYVANFHFDFYSVNRYDMRVTCIPKTNYRTRNITDVAGLPQAIIDVITKAREYMYNISASGIFDRDRQNEENYYLARTEIFLAIQDVNHQFNGSVEVWNMVMTYYHLLEARLQLMSCNYGMFQQYVTGPYLKYIGQS